MERLDALLFFFVISFFFQSHSLYQGHRLEGNRDRLSEALRYIDAVQNPENCSGLEYSVVGMGINGGFAAQFQYASAEWMRVFASHGYTKPVLIVGPLNGYSQVMFLMILKDTL